MPGKPQPIRTKFGIRRQDKGWQRSGNFGRDCPFGATWGLRRVLRCPSYFCVVIQTTFRQLHNGRFSPHLATKRSSIPSINPGRHFRNFYFRGHLPPLSEIESRSNRRLTQSRLQVMGCTAAERYFLLHVVVQGPGIFRRRLASFVRRTVAELRGVKVAKFSDFCILSHTKRLKSIFRWAEWLRFFHVVVEGSKGCLPAAEFSCDFW